MKKIIICKYITKNGKRIYPRNARFFRFEVETNKEIIK
jgi:hypothetical protein